MVQRSKYAAQKDAPIMPRKEEFVIVMGQRENNESVVMKDAPIKSRKEDFVDGIGRSIAKRVLSTSVGQISMMEDRKKSREEIVVGMGRSTGIPWSMKTVRRLSERRRKQKVQQQERRRKQEHLLRL